MLRGLAVGVGGVAIANLLRGGPATHAKAAVETPWRTAAQAPLAPATTRQWVVSADGWRICFATVPPADRPQAAPPVPSTFSPYDHLIVRHAEAEGFDWRLVAALIAEESGFKPTSQSEKGAFGLMQIMPVAAEAVGAERFTAPDDNVRTGVRYLRHLSDRFGEVDAEDRLKLVLAAYNMGPGHVQDAQMLALELGQDPNRWAAGMEAVLPLLEDTEYSELLPNGYAQGRQTVRFVNRVIERYQRYQRIVGRTPGTRPGPQVAGSNRSTRSAKAKARS